MATSGPNPKSVALTEIPAPGIHAPPPEMTRQGLQRTSTVRWSTGFCGCFPSYFGRWCISFWCPCYTFGQVSEIVDRGSSSCGLNGAMYCLLASLIGCACFYSMVYRTKMRKQYVLDGNVCEDCLCHCCCESCALTQEYIELKNRGYDLSLGWVGNDAERFNRGVAMAPVTEPGMTR